MTNTCQTVNCLANFWLLSHLCYVWSTFNHLQCLICKEIFLGKQICTILKIYRVPDYQFRLPILGCSIKYSVNRLLVAIAKKLQLPEIYGFSGKNIHVYG